MTTNEVDPALAAADSILRQPYARIILPEADGTFRGEIMEFPGCITTGETAAETLSLLEEVAKSWLMAAIESGQPIPQPVENNSDYSGRLVLRISKSLHKKAAWFAEREGVSLNQFISISLSESVGEKHKSLQGLTFVAAQCLWYSQVNMFPTISSASHFSASIAAGSGTISVPNPAAGVLGQPNMPTSLIT